MIYCISGQKVCGFYIFCTLCTSKFRENQFSCSCCLYGNIVSRKREHFHNAKITTGTVWQCWVDCYTRLDYSKTPEPECCSFRNRWAKSLALINLWGSKVSLNSMNYGDTVPHQGTCFPFRGRKGDRNNSQPHTLYNNSKPDLTWCNVFSTVNTLLCKQITEIKEYSKTCL